MSSSEEIPHLHDRYKTVFPLCLNNIQNIDIKIFLKEIGDEEDKDTNGLKKKEISAWIRTNGLWMNPREKEVSLNLINSSTLQDIFKDLTSQKFSLNIICQKEMVLIRNYDKFEIHVLYTKEWGEYGPSIQLNSLLRDIFSTFFPFFNRFLLHSAGIVNKGHAILFVGPNNAGKSTVAQLSHPRNVLNDDQIVIEKAENSFYAHSTPFASLYSGPERNKIGGIVLLEKSKKFLLTRIRPLELVPCLLHEHKRYIHFLPRHARIQAFHLLTDLCLSAPVFCMRFPANHINWETIEAFLNECH